MRDPRRRRPQAPAGDVLIRTGLTHLRANAVAYAALFVALGGVAFAAASPLADRRGTVDSRNIKNDEIKAKDLGRGLKRHVGIAPSAKIPNGDYLGTFGGAQITLAVDGGEGTAIDIAAPAGTNCAFTHQSSDHMSNIELRANQIVVVDQRSAGLPQATLWLEFDGESTLSTFSDGSYVATDTGGVCSIPPGVDLDLVPPPPADGPYFGAFNGGNSGLTLEFENAKVVDAVLESATSVSAACNFQTSPTAAIDNSLIEPGLLSLVIANSPEETFQAQVAYKSKRAIVLPEATVSSSNGTCSLPQGVELGPLAR